MAHAGATTESISLLLDVEPGDMLGSERVILRPQLNPRWVSYCMVVTSMVLVFSIMFIPALILLPCIYYGLRAQFRSMRVVVTDHTLVFSSGMYGCCCMCWNSTVKRIPLDKITDLRVSVGCLERKFGLATIAVQTAGQAGEMPELVLTGILDNVAFVDQVMDARRRVMSGLPATTTMGGAASSGIAHSREIVDVRDSLLRMEQSLAVIQQRLADRPRSHNATAPVPSAPKPDEHPSELV